MKQQGRDRLAGSILLVVAGLWCWGVVATIPAAADASRLGPRGFPLGLGVLLVALSALLIVSSFTKPEEEPVEALKADGPPLGVEIWAVLCTLGFLVGYTAMLWAAGFLVATVTIVAAGLVLILGKRNWLFVGSMSVGTALVVFVTFNKILGVYLPHGRWVDIWF